MFLRNSSKMKSATLLQILGVALSIQTTHARLHGSIILRNVDRLLISCSSDSDCATDSEFCSRGTCRPFGSCDTVLDCMNPSNEQFLPQCLGYRTCEGGSCGMLCSESSCSSEDLIKETADCPIRPCDVIQCEEAYESCVDDYCGGCNALFFDAAGGLVCTKNIEQESGSCNTDYDACRREDGMIRKLTCMMEMTRQVFSCALQP